MAIVQSALAAFTESYQKAWDGQVRLAAEQRQADFRDAQLAEQARQFNASSARQESQFGQTQALNTANSVVQNRGRESATDIAVANQAYLTRTRNLVDAARGTDAEQIARIRSELNRNDLVNDNTENNRRITYVQRLATNRDLAGANSAAKAWGLGISFGAGTDGKLVQFGSDGNIAGRVPSAVGILSPYGPNGSAPDGTPTQGVGGYSMNPSRFGVTGVAPTTIQDGVGRGASNFAAIDPRRTDVNNPFTPDYSNPPLQAGAYLDSLRQQGAMLDYQMSPQSNIDGYGNPVYGVADFTDLQRMRALQRRSRDTENATSDLSRLYRDQP